MAAPPGHYVYIVRCADGSLYTGYARNPATRIAVHNTGKGARYTSGRRPVRLVYSESYETIGDALRREYELKRLPRRAKEALIARAPRGGYRRSSRGGSSGTTVVTRKTAKTKARKNVSGTKRAPASSSHAAPRPRTNDATRKLA